MTYSEILDALKYESANLLLDRMNDERVVQLIDELIAQGIYFDEFLEVLDKSYYRPNFLEALNASLLKLEVTIPETVDQAVWILLEYHISKMASEDGNAFNGLEDFMRDVYWNFDFGPHTKKYLGDSHGVENLIGLYWGYADLRDRYAPKSPPKDDVESCETKAKSFARDWIFKYSNNPKTIK
jgi:hypothetical protein